MVAWEDLGTVENAGTVASHLIAGLSDAGFDIVALRDYPLTALLESAELHVEFEDDLSAGFCGGGGYYRDDPPTIHLHQATYRRDNFTLLHELGHHLQRRHPDWHWILMDIHPQEVRRSVEEAVSNDFAAQVLMPVDQSDLDATAIHPADVMAGIFARTGASRSAAMQRVRGMLPRAARWILAVADEDGRVITSLSTYEDAQPPIDLVQEGFREVYAEAVDGGVRRDFLEGVEYRTGSVLSDMRVEAVLDHQERYVFIALRPTAVNGAGTLTFPSAECSNPACGEFFSPRQSPGRCDSCQQFRCPTCRRCSCEATRSATVCPGCNLAYTASELAGAEHECF
ncbi:ImmA/IrrE family metallo-endopeptidase [Gordonia sp. NPDC003425]